MTAFLKLTRDYSLGVIVNLLGAEVAQKILTGFYRGVQVFVVCSSFMSFLKECVLCQCQVLISVSQMF
jgi:hypothetical protein